MILNGILIFLALALIILISSFIFWILLNKDIKLWQAIKLICISGALNKILLTGSGYAAASWKLKSDDFPVYKSLSSFGVLELFSVMPWLILGLFWGAEIAIRIPLFLIVLFVLVLGFAIYKRKSMLDFLKNALSYLKKIRSNILMVIPLVLINIMIGIIYYFFLFRAFGFNCDFLNILKIVSVAFTIGYLSPSPAGLGFKEGGMVFLLMQQNLSFSSACYIAIADRIIMTGFYIILGFLFGAGIIRDEVRKKLWLQKKERNIT